MNLTALFSNPFKKHDHFCQKSMRFFWSTGDIDTSNGMLELSGSYRNKDDAWFAEFLRECR